MLTLSMSAISGKADILVHSLMSAWHIADIDADDEHVRF